MKHDKNSQMVKIKTSDGSTFRGKINLHSETKQMDRISDFFLKGKNPFVTIYDVAAHGSTKLFIINKDHIIWVTQDE